MVAGSVEVIDGLGDSLQSVSISHYASNQVSPYIALILYQLKLTVRSLMIQLRDPVATLVDIFVAGSGFRVFGSVLVHGLLETRSSYHNMHMPRIFPRINDGIGALRRQGGAGNRKFIRSLAIAQSGKGEEH